MLDIPANEPSAVTVVCAVGKGEILHGIGFVHKNVDPSE
jgi:hypothetical protein